MVTPEQEFANFNTHNAVDFSQSYVPERANVSANSNLVSRTVGRPCCEINSFYRAFDKIINTRNAIIALFIMLILLLTLLDPVFSGDAVKSELIQPPTVEQTLREGPAPLAPANNPAPVPDAALVKAEITRSVSTEAVLIKPSRARRVTTTLARAKTLTSQPARTSDTAVPELAVMAPASDSSQPSAAMNEDIKTDAAATLTAVSNAEYVKIAHSGDALDDKADTWECVEDKSNNLTWEVKKNDGGIRDKDHSYSWLSNINGKTDGISNGGRCKGGVRCDTSSYARAMNEQELCGYSDWRMPTRSELETLVKYEHDPAKATINSTFFPEAVPSWYWSSSENTNREAYAWYVLFRNGVSLNDLKERPKHIRLVRGRVQQ